MTTTMPRGRFHRPAADPAGTRPVFEEGLDELKERQLVFQLTRQLATAQFIRADRVESERLWQEAAALGMDPGRIVALLFGVHDHSDTEAMEEIDRSYRQERRLRARRWPWPLGRFRPSPARARRHRRAAAAAA